MSTVITYETWREKTLGALNDDTVVECPACDGTGIDECACCGSEGDCETCDGEGKVKAGTLAPFELNKLVSRKKYAEAVRNDLVALAEWRGTSIDEEAFRLGLAPYMTVKHKAIKFTEVEG